MVKAAPRVGVLALQGDFREHVAAFSRLGVSVGTVRTPAELFEVDALVLPGGESTTMSRLLRVFELEEPLRDRLAQGMPCMATCAGLILLSTTIVDGVPDQIALRVFDITVRRNAYGSQTASFEAGLEVAGMTKRFHGVFIRAPKIESVGQGVKVLASYKESPVAILQGPNIGLAFHPEMSGDDRLHQLFVKGI